MSFQIDYKQHALPDMVYFHFIFLKATPLAERWDLLGLRLRGRQSHIHQRGNKLSPLPGWTVPQDGQLNKHVVTGEQGQVQHPIAFHSSAKVQNCAVLAVPLTVPEHQGIKKIMQI